MLPDPSTLHGGSLSDFTAVIPAGGTGTRLWPLSRARRPKFLLDLADTGQSLLEDTIDRLRPLAGNDMLVVTGRQHAGSVAEKIGVTTSRRPLVEPVPRNSMPAIGLAAAVLERENSAAILGSFPADHVIDDPAAFRRSVSTAHRVAQHGYLVTLGITPTYPATGFGYIEVGAELHGITGAHRAAAFREKPAEDLALSYVRQGKHLWNAGVFVAQASTLLGLLSTYDAAMVATLRDLARRPDELGDAWGDLPSISIDHALAEPAARDGHVVVVPSRCGWDDIGDYASLSTRLPATAESPDLHILGNEARVMTADSSGLIVPHGGRMVVALGLPDAIVVDTPDALLLTTLDRAQDIGSVIQMLRDRGREDLV